MKAAVAVLALWEVLSCSFARPACTRRDQHSCGLPTKNEVKSSIFFNEKMYTGRVPIGGGSMFFVFFPSRGNASHDALTMWLTGVDS